MKLCKFSKTVAAGNCGGLTTMCWEGQIIAWWHQDKGWKTLLLIHCGFTCNQLLIWYWKGQGSFGTYLLYLCALLIGFQCGCLYSPITELSIRLSGRRAVPEVLRALFVSHCEVFCSPATCTLSASHLLRISVLRPSSYHHGSRAGLSTAWLCAVWGQRWGGGMSGWMS